MVEEKYLSEFEGKSYISLKTHNRLMKKRAKHYGEEIKGHIRSLKLQAGEVVKKNIKQVFEDVEMLIGYMKLKDRVARLKEVKKKWLG